MNKYEELLEQSKAEGVYVDEKVPFKGELGGLYISGNIALSKKLQTIAEKSCTLAEELGHHYTSNGNILDLSDPLNRKQEMHARVWAYDRMISFDSIISAYLAGCKNRYEAAEFLNVPEDFLQATIDSWVRRYGFGVVAGGYRIILIPNLQIEKIEC